ncbi:MAG: hypothetical protein E3K38_14705 [Candidatus Kuenenia stuttgartiensis]|nr:hypothetical protein [Candidatus Kuenenia stuttgartiensis]
MELDIFDKKGLVRACELIGYKNKNNSLEDNSDEKLKAMITERVNPGNTDLREQYYRTLDLFKIDYSKSFSDDQIKYKLYEFNCERLTKALGKMSKKKKEILAKKIESTIDPMMLDELKKVGKKGVAAGGGILLLQGGAVFITGSNLGICMLLTTGLSGISGLVGITFPFAAYTTAAIIGGKVIAIGGFLTAPYVFAPLLGLSLYLIYRNVRNKKYVNLAGVNYLIESKKALGI